MLHILKKIADWLVTHEEKAAEDCRVPEDIIDEWEETVDEKLNYLEKHNKTNSPQYEMLKDIKQRIEEIRKIRAKRCKIK